MKLTSLKHLTRGGHYRTASPKISDEDFAESMLQAKTNEADWVSLAKSILTGSSTLKGKHSWKSAAIGLRAFDRPDCQGAADIAERNAKEAK